MNKTANPCRLYLILPERIGAGFEADLEAALAAGDVACALLSRGAADESLAATLCRVVQARGAAFLVENDVGLARSIAADGVHIADGDTGYGAARAALGPNAIVGARGGLSRHASLVLAESGADYVALGDGAADPAATLAMIEWWAPIVEAPCVAWTAATPAAARALAVAGADFVAVGAPVWRSDRPAAESVHDFTAALDAAREAA